MKSEKCATCGLVGPLNSMFTVNEQNYCEPCADDVVARLQGLNAPLSVLHCVDPTICSICCSDAGSTVLPLAGQTPVCAVCHDKVYHRDYPRWLKLGLVAALVLLVVALVQGQNYFRLGRALFRAERLLASKQYKSSVPLLRRVVDGAPDCEKCILLLVKADLLSGEVEDADVRIRKHNDGRFDTKDELTDEVSALFARVERAVALSNQAAELANGNKSEEALKKIHEAHDLFPEWAVLVDAENQILVGLQFEHKDYDGFLASSESIAQKKPNDPMAVAQVSSALACKFAVTGNDEFRIRAEQMLARADQLSTTEEQRRDVQEYRERLFHRLKTREIISRQDYDRRFRNVIEGSK